MTDIATSMAEAFYGLPAEFKEKCLEYTTEEMHEIFKLFEEKKIERKYMVNLQI